jgi:hypothetical protein
MYLTSLPHSHHFQDIQMQVQIIKESNELVVAAYLITRKRCHVPAIWSPNLVWSHNDQELLFVDMYVINKVPVSCSRRTRCVVVDTSLQYKRSDLICIGARTAIGTHSCVLTYTDYEQVMYRRLTHYYHREYDVCRSRQVHRMGVPMQCRTSRR